MKISHGLTREKYFNALLDLSKEKTPVAQLDKFFKGRNVSINVSTFLRRHSLVNEDNLLTVNPTLELVDNIFAWVKARNAENKKKYPFGRPKKNKIEVRPKTDERYQLALYKLKDFFSERKDAKLYAFDKEFGVASGFCKACFNLGILDSTIEGVRFNKDIAINAKLVAKLREQINQNHNKALMNGKKKSNGADSEVIKEIKTLKDTLIKAVNTLLTAIDNQKQRNLFS